MDRDKGTWNDSSGAAFGSIKQVAESFMGEKKKRQRLSEERQGPAKRSLKPSADVAPVDDNGFARKEPAVLRASIR